MRVLPSCSTHLRRCAQVCLVVLPALAACGTSIGSYTPSEQSKILQANAARFYDGEVWYPFLETVEVSEDTARLVTSNALVASLMCADVAAVAFDELGRSLGVRRITVLYEPTGGELADCEVPSSPGSRPALEDGD